MLGSYLYHTSYIPRYVCTCISLHGFYTPSPQLARTRQPHHVIPFLFMYHTRLKSSVLRIYLYVCTPYRSVIVGTLLVYQSRGARFNQACLVIGYRVVCS